MDALPHEAVKKSIYRFEYLHPSNQFMQLAALDGMWPASGSIIMPAIDGLSMLAPYCKSLLSQLYADVVEQALDEYKISATQWAGLSPMQYVKKTRVEKAANILDNTSANHEYFESGLSPL